MSLDAEGRSRFGFRMPAPADSVRKHFMTLKVMKAGVGWAQAGEDCGDSARRIAMIVSPKRTFSRRVLSSILLCLSALCANAVAGASSGADAPPGPVHGLWVWKSKTVLEAPRGAETLKDFCRSGGINEVYVSYSASTSSSSVSAADGGLLAHLIGRLHGEKIRVEALLSSSDADEPGKHREKLLGEVREVVQFNQAHPGSRFDGIHLDVEPQQRPENKGAGNLQFLPGLVDAFRAVRVVAEPAGMTVNADIQNKLLKGDAGQRRMLLSALPRVTLMMYELDSPDDGKSVDQKADDVERNSKKYLDMTYDGLSGGNLAKTAIALRTPDYGALLPRMLRKLDENNGANPHYLGWARHSYNDALTAAQ
jgi:hypothetical protein